MNYKLICKSQNIEKDYSDCVEAERAKIRHLNKGHNAVVVPIPPNTEDTYYSCLRKSGFYASAFRINSKSSILTTDPITRSSGDKSIKMQTISEDVKPTRSDGVNSFFKRLVKLVPSEIIALYIALYGVIPKSEGSLDKYGNLIFISAFILLLISRLFGTKITGYTTFSYFKTAQIWSILISAVSFVIWVLALGHKIPLLSVFGEDPIIIQIIMILWTFTIPIIYKGEK